MVEAKRIKMKPTGGGHHHVTRVIQIPIHQIKGNVSNAISSKQTPASSRPGSQDKHQVAGNVVQTNTVLAGGKSLKSTKNSRISASSVNLNQAGINH